MLELGFLERDDRTKRYRLSSKLLDFAYLYLRSDPLVAVAHPHLVQLSHTLEEDVSLSILDEADVIYVARILTKDERSLPSLVGGRMPSFCTSNGRILLAYRGEAEAARIVHTSDRTPLTAATLTEPAAILAEIRGAREKGYCLVEEESEPGVVSAAVAVFDRAGMAAAAINIPLLKSKRPQGEIETILIPQMKRVAGIIGQALSAMQP